jgi:hypothetical protein
MTIERTNERSGKGIRGSSEEDISTKGTKEKPERECGIKTRNKSFPVEFQRVSFASDNITMEFRSVHLILLQ